MPSLFNTVISNAAFPNNAASHSSLSAGARPSVAIIGCGWFGLPLAAHLLAEGHQVKGCKRSQEGVALLESLGIAAFLLDLDVEGAVPSALLDVDVIIINLPPGLRRGETGYIERLSRLKASLVKLPKRLIFISSTGVYPELSQTMTEHDACNHSPSAEVLLAAEALFAELNTTVVRFAGLVGPGRHPGRFFAGKTDVAGGSMPVNLVHLADCIKAVSMLISSPDVARVYNLCAPHHPDKQTFYIEAARCAGLSLPQFTNEMLALVSVSNESAGGKSIDGSLICRSLGFEYSYPDPMAMLLCPEAF